MCRRGFTHRIFLSPDLPGRVCSRHSAPPELLWRATITVARRRSSPSQRQCPRQRQVPPCQCCQCRPRCLNRSRVATSWPLDAASSGKPATAPWAHGAASLCADPQAKDENNTARSPELQICFTLSVLLPWCARVQYILRLLLSLLTAGEPHAACCEHPPHQLSPPERHTPRPFSLPPETSNVSLAKPAPIVLTGLCCADTRHRLPTSSRTYSFNAHAILRNRFLHDLVITGSAWTTQFL